MICCFCLKIHNQICKAHEKWMCNMSPCHGCEIGLVRWQYNSKDSSTIRQLALVNVNILNKDQQRVNVNLHWPCSITTQPLSINAHCLHSWFKHMKRGELNEILDERIMKNCLYALNWVTIVQIDHFFVGYTVFQGLHFNAGPFGSSSASPRNFLLYEMIVSCFESLKTVF